MRGPRLLYWSSGIKYRPGTKLKSVPPIVNTRFPVGFDMKEAKPAFASSVPSVDWRKVVYAARGR
jgi:hypothetical protein